MNNSRFPIVKSPNFRSSPVFDRKLIFILLNRFLFPFRLRINETGRAANSRSATKAEEPL